jgi:hypothetical protein
MNMQDIDQLSKRREIGELINVLKMQKVGHSPDERGSQEFWVKDQDCHIGEEQWLLTNQYRSFRGCSVLFCFVLLQG